MSFAPVTQDTFQKIVQLGKYYFPAHLHYSRETTITCDRCQRNQIPACIGWQQYDLCLNCAQKVAEQLTRSSEDDDKFTFMMTSSAFPDRHPFTTGLRPLPPSQDTRTTTLMQLSSAFPVTNMESSSAFPMRTRMRVSSAFPDRTTRTKMHVSSTFQPR